MSLHFHMLVVKEITRETQDCVSVAFDIPEALRQTFAFQQGQSITLKKTINNTEIRRSYSVCTAPHENELRIAVKKAGNGLFSTFINESLQKGDTMEVLPPTGSFFRILQKEQARRYVAFAAGSGITPVISIIKASLYTEPQSSFTLVYSNRSTHSIIFKEELEALKNRYMSRLSVIYILSREKTNSLINSGRIDTNKLMDLKTLIHYQTTDDFFICGPEQLIFTVKEFLEQQGISNRKIHFELFTVPDSVSSKAIETIRPQPEPQSESTVTIKMDGISTSIAVPFDGISILNAALQQGIDLPFACKGGVCCSCKAQLLEGRVDMDVHWGLEDEEVQQGYILTCQSHPKTNNVIIDFDIR